VVENHVDRETWVLGRAFTRNALILELNYFLEEIGRGEIAWLKIWIKFFDHAFLTPLGFYFAETTLFEGGRT
jgi:hypothetical protein